MPDCDQEAYYCSLIYKAELDDDQYSQPNDWTTVRFPFGSAESDDGHKMHQVQQPDGVQTDYSHDRAGLIWPHADGVGLFAAKANWSSGDYNQVLGRFIRDPLSIGSGKQNDWTATNDAAPTPGSQFRITVWPLLVSVGEPVAFQVRHYGGGPVKLSQAQFKLVIWPLAPAL